MLIRSRRPATLVIVALVAIFAASISFASAKTFHHGKTVWFSDVTLSDGDVVNGDLDIMFGNVTCESGATIDGNVRTFFGNFDEDDGCTLTGRQIQAFSSDSMNDEVPWLAPMSADMPAQTHGIFRKVAWDVVVVLAFLLFPLRVRVALDRIEKHPGLSAATGAIVLVAAIPVAILLLLSIIGIPLIPLEIAAFFAALWIGHASVALLLGRRLYELLRPHTTPSPLGALILGLIVVTAAQTLPVVGWAVTALVVLTGLGAALLAFVRETKFQSFTRGAVGSGAPGSGPPMNRPA
ncbi:MAG: hypothetical protein IAI50_00025 [Candidatus Eremiobacteraeota bacterium]|nr:hypothetical protein [Candidatus Eremiobacteraeota bacterium]